jgi:hypothetical protein
MSQRGSGYARKALDLYETPDWVTKAVVPHLGSKLHVWEPAAGGGKMVRALGNAGYTVEASDPINPRFTLPQQSWTFSSVKT